MKRLLLWGTSFIGVALLLVSCGPKTVREIPLEDFFKKSERTGFSISPDGKHLAYMAPWEGRMNIFIRSLEDTAATRLTSVSDRDLGGCFWANNERILYVKDSGGDENFRLYGVQIDGSNSICYTPAGVKVQIIDALKEIDSLMIIGTNARNPQIFDAYRLNLNTGEMSLIGLNPGHYSGWMTDNDGKLRVAYAIVDGVNNQILYRETEKDEFKVVLTTNFKESVAYQCFTPDNKLVYALTNRGRDKAILVSMDPATAVEIDSLFGNERYDLQGISYSEHKKCLESVNYVGHKDVFYHFFDKEAEKIHKKLCAHFPNKEVTPTSWTKDESKAIVYVGGDKTRGTYYIYDVKTDKVDKICDLAPWIIEEEMASMTPITYTSRDGLEIEGYLTLPVGYTMENAKNLAVIVNPHGGPWARDYWGYSPEIQFLANRGYAVLQMNFRGSTTRGRKFMELSYKQWGQNMQNDITDGVNWLIEKGIADPARIAIYGASYGGYATLAGVTYTPDLYACAVDYVGVSNLFTFMESFPPYWLPLLEMTYEMVGNPKTDSLMMATYSPSLNADKIKTPLFVAQGANDPRVKKSESDQMVEALKARGVEVEYMVKDDEGHGFRNQENQFEFYRAIEKFFAKHLKEGAKK